MDRLIQSSCLALKALDFDGIRVDKATQVTLDATSIWAVGVQECAVKLWKKNTSTTSEVAGSNTFGSLYL